MCNNILAQSGNIIDSVCDTVCFLNEIIFILKRIQFDFKESCDKQNLILMVISYEIYEAP